MKTSPPAPQTGSACALGTIPVTSTTDVLPPVDTVAWKTAELPFLSFLGAQQPKGVHGPSRVVDRNAFPWQDGEWKGLPLESYVFYELHVGTFTAEGTFDAVIPHLDELVRLGILES